MKSFSEYLVEQKSNSLVIFDIDDTLFENDADVWVKKDGERIKKLSKGAYTNYKLKPGESLDFEDFKSSIKFAKTAKPIKSIVKIAKTLINRNTDVFVITARADMDNKELFLDVFRSNGINIDKSHVYRAGNTKENTPEAKVKIIKNLLSKRPYTSVYMFDDTKENLVRFKNLENQFSGIMFHSMWVDGGTVRRV